jgi:hypothetical protein
MKRVPIQRWMLMVAAFALTTALAAPRAAADEFTLKDGRKISGTIVGYEQNMFRIQTDYGFVLVRKDAVVSIRVEGGGEKKPEAAPAGKRKAAAPAQETSEAPSRTAPPTPKPAPPRVAHKAPAPPPVSRPLNEPLPAHLREHMEGNDYVNDTFQFAMYKPPDWKLFEELHREKVSAIVAMSSPDERTLLFVDRQVWSGRPDLGDDRMETKLRNMYEDYKKLSQAPTHVDGFPALRCSFTGVLDGVEWHGISVRVERGNTVFGIVGLTSAETYQFQQAVFNKMVRSFHFIAPSAREGTALHLRSKP